MCSKFFISRPIFAGVVAIVMVFLAVATALTLWSGYVYFANYFRGRSEGGQR